ncbi:hypothetical protein CGC59_01785 [Capnocytophaga sputigena]|uniref:DNA primase TraC n=1 Tax=Capnocytophaga sputigena TaxID=1019 RepID=A0A250F001_CAPSP|nr:zincin-like metallopeptidase domain-containing protein [Capnocytophaga sputigena]ATA78483.1 hypothetical protein CGC59_01785 [Capnocytophaga sputigena]
MKEFIALHNRTVSRDEIQTVIALAKEQNNTEVIYRLSKILNDHPDSNRFNINIINYPQETTQQVALAGTRHSGDYREALDECGRLKKGWHFVDGKVLKVQKRSGLLSQYTEKEFGHPFTKTLKAKFKELNWKYDRKNKRYYTPVPENEAEKEQQAQMFAFIEQEKATLEVNKPEKSPKTPTDKSAPSDSSSKTYTAETFAKDLDFNTLKRSYSWISFDPDARAERDRKQWGEMFYSLYNSLSEEAKKQGVLEKYNSAFNNGYNSLLKLEREIIATRSKTFSTAITGGAGITEKQISTNEKRMRLQSEKSELWSQKYDKLHKILEKIAKNKPEDLYEEGDIIKSTDNNAMTKLQQKLKMLQDRKIMLKNGVVAAKEYQKNKDLSVFKKYNIDEETTETIVNHIDKGGKPTEKDMYNWFTMPYLNRDIKEVEKRIAILEKNQAKGTDEILIEGGKIVHNGEAQRLQIFFDGIPSKEVREALKAHAFKWAPTAKAWQRTLTENAKYAVNQYLIKTGILKLRTALSAPHQEDEIAFLAAAGIDYFPEAPDDETQGLGKPVPTVDIYKMVTDKIIGMLKSASPTDYHRAWKDDAFFIPLNYDSKKPYRGVNRLLLQERIGFAGAFRNPYFLTFKQIKKHKGTLKKGAKGYEVIYYSIRYVVPADKNSGRKAFSSTNAQKVLDFLHKYKLSEDIVGRIPMIRYYNVYNGADIENIDFKLDELQIGRAVPDSATENRAAQLIVENYPNPPAIKNEGNQAYYNPASDYIKLPKQEQFDTVNDYYRTLFHELTHSTGHNKRLNRGIHLMLEKDDYAKEELVAEFGAVFLSAWAGIMWYNNKNHAAYLKGWNSAIKEAQSDNKFLMRAASLAQQATDYILALDKDGNPAFLKKLQGKKASKNTPKTPTDKSAPSDSSSNKNIFLEEYRLIKATYPEHLIIVSMEDHQNYCMYGKDAVIAADILNLQLLKLKRNDEFSISVGFKYKNLREYLEKLVKAGYKVALKEYLYEPQSSPKKNTTKSPSSDKSAPFQKPTGQTVLFGKYPETDTDRFKKMKVSELRTFTMKYYNLYLKGDSATIEKYVKEVVFINTAGRKIAYGEAMYSAKAAVIAHLKTLIKNSTYNNWGDRKASDGKDVLGYLNFKSKITIDGKKRHVRISLVVYKDRRTELKNVEVGKNKKVPHFAQDPVGTLQDGRNETLSTESVAKTVPNSALSAPRHAGILKEALTEKGKLKKGWYFQDYGIIDPKGKYHPLERDYSLEYNLIEKELRDRAFQQDEKRKIKGFEENKKLEEAIKVFLKELSKENKKHFKNSKAMEVFYWAFPFTLERNSTFYTFEESNPYINKNLQELDKYFSDDNELFERLENYETLRRYRLKSLGLHISTKISSFIDKQGKVIRGDSNKLNQKYGLSAPEVFVEHSPDPATQSAPSITPRNNSLANRMLALQNRTFETFIIAEPQMQAFLGDVERKNTGSTAITITGGAGSGKTRFAFQFINALAQNYKVGHASLEEQPDSKLYFDKVQQYLDQTAQANVEAPEIENMQDLQALIERNDVIVIDSFTKIREWDRNFLLDRDLRKKYNGKLFLIIFQQTVAGNMRGGTTSEFDGDIILYTQVFPDYRENYIYPSKNRYNSTPSEQLRYSVYHQQLLPSESTPSDSSPVTSNTYEVIY